ncbi:MAG TPA: TadE/TadG family type IV pilus assembly protein [Amnibacterium sp.]|jgi:Flp pilus assembly protein TadG|uniref:TadE/TadG family type IV pilus assembly protein n=1 Tax=Amnibacterium sp. TaxID=1872496 RepID=UPI002F936C1E
MTPFGERGSAPVEFVLVGVLLVALVIGVLQVAAVLFVRNTALDAAAEGARWAAIDGAPAAGVARTRQVLTTALGPGYARDVVGGTSAEAGIPVAVVTVRTPLPVLGLLGPAAALEVSGHAALEPAP